MSCRLVAAAGLLLSAAALAQMPPSTYTWSVKVSPARDACRLDARSDRPVERSPFAIFVIKPGEGPTLPTFLGLTEQQVREFELPAAGTVLRVGVRVYEPRRGGDLTLPDEPFELSTLDGAPILRGRLPPETLLLLERGRYLHVTYAGRIIYGLDLRGSAAAVQDMRACVLAVIRGPGDGR